MEMQGYENNSFRQSSDEQIRQNKEQVEQVKNILAQNINKLYERDQKLDHLNRRVENLEQNSQEFEKTTTKTNRFYMWKNLKWTIIFACVIIAIIIIIGLSIWLSVR